MAKFRLISLGLTLLSQIGKEIGIYEIELPGSSALDVYCDSSLVDSGWIVIQRRQDGSVDFNRPMRDYRKGFGELSGEFFLGLDKLHLLTKSRKPELYIYMKSYVGDYVGYVRYSHILIGGEEENFKLKSLGTYSGNAGDVMGYNINMEFSTYDEDRDNNERFNCATNYHSGWWFNNCGFM